jgi:hypothetical protein
MPQDMALPVPMALPCGEAVLKNSPVGGKRLAKPDKNEL